MKLSRGAVTISNVAKGTTKLLRVPDGIGDDVVRLRAWRDDDVALLREGSEDDENSGGDSDDFDDVYVLGKVSFNAATDAQHRGDRRQRAY